MKFRWSRTSIAWLVTAGVMFVVAFVLTQVITATQGGLLERGEKPGDADSKVQVAAIYEPGATPEHAERYYVNYRLNAAGEQAEITFFIPPNAQPVIVVSGLVDIRDGGPNVSAQKLYSNAYGRDVHFLTVTPWDQAQSVTCIVSGQAESETFTSRMLTLLAYAPGRGQDYRLTEKLTTERASPDEVASPLQGLDPIPSMRINVSNIAGARDIHFVGGFQADEDVYSPETKRLLIPGEYAWVFWDDLYSQQMRDIALIVIGTLIGIGVTVMIEGLRPFIESLGKSAAPKKKSADVPPDPPAHSS